MVTQTPKSGLRALTGIRSSGNLHIGNYLGAIRPGLALQEKYQCLFFIADLHSLTTNKEPAQLSEQRLDIVAAWLAFGLDLEKHILWAQSDVPQVTEWAWYLSCVTGMGLLEKSHAYKDAAAQSKELNHGVFAYPVLMAADILMYDPDVVPVGKDQKQHVEMARDMAGAFNAVYGEGLMKLPEPLIDEKVMLIPGVDGRKMSKSYGNEIGLFADEKTLRKQVMSVKSDSTALEAPKTLQGNLVGDLFIHFATPSQFEDLSKRLAAGNLGWGHAKDELFQVINQHLSPVREKYRALRKDVAGLEKVLNVGAARASALAEPILNRVRSASGFRPAVICRN